MQALRQRGSPPVTRQLVAALTLVGGLACWSPSALALPPGCSQAVGFGCSLMVNSDDSNGPVSAPVPDQPGVQASTAVQSADLSSTTPFAVASAKPPERPDAAPSCPIKLCTLIPQTWHRAIDWAHGVGKQLGQTLGLSPQPSTTPLHGPRVEAPGPETDTTGLTANWTPPPLMPWRQPSLAAGKPLTPSLLDDSHAAAPPAPGAGVVFSMGDGRPEPVATQRRADWLSNTPTLQQQRRRLQLERQRVEDAAQFNLGLRVTF